MAPGSQDSLKALREGQARWQERQREEAIERVAAFLAWLKADSALWSLYHKGCITREERIARQPELLEIPTDNDFAIARGAAAEAAAAQ